MNTWVPLWTSTVQSTLWEEPMHVRVMFLTMLLIRDPDHVVRCPFRRLVKAANLAEDVMESAKLAEDALKILSEPDARSIDHQDFEGRRISPVEDGWLVLNGEKYAEEMVRLTARIRKSQKQKERRAALAALEQERGVPFMPKSGHSTKAQRESTKLRNDGQPEQADRLDDIAHTLNQKPTPPC